MATGDDTLYQVVFELPDQAITIKVRGDEFIWRLPVGKGSTYQVCVSRAGASPVLSRFSVEGWISRRRSATYEEDQRAGFVLICSGRPCSDLRLRPGAVEDMRVHRDTHILPVLRGTRA